MNCNKFLAWKTGIDAVFDKAKTATICDTLHTRGVIPKLISWARFPKEERSVMAALGDWQVDIGTNTNCLIYGA